MPPECIPILFYAKGPTTEIWHYFWKTRGGTHIGNRGLAMWKNYLYMETPDNLSALDARTGQERWNVEIADLAQQYFSTPAPVVIGDHVIVGTGNDLDGPGFLQSFDPGLETWKSLDAARHGGGQPWVNGAYDPETKLYSFSTGNPTPAYTPGARDGDNLFTSSMIAVNVDTGKMAWYFQTSPNDTHDWDSAQTPTLVDGVIDGRPRKLVLTAARNGYFFVIDRVDSQGRAAAQRREGSFRRRLPRLADGRRHDQLAAAGVLTRHGLSVRGGEERLLGLLPDRARSARVDGSRRESGNQRRVHRRVPHRDRLPQRRKNRLAPPVSHRRHAVGVRSLLTMV